MNLYKENDLKVESQSKLQMEWYQGSPKFHQNRQAEKSKKCEEPPKNVFRVAV